jgi:hypothetical protein
VKLKQNAGFHKPNLAFEVDIQGQIPPCVSNAGLVNRHNTKSTATRPQADNRREGNNSEIESSLFRGRKGGRRGNSNVVKEGEGMEDVRAISIDRYSSKGEGRFYHSVMRILQASSRFLVASSLGPYLNSSLYISRTVHQ